jgi:adenylate cyclase
VSNQESQEIERTFRVRQIPKNIAKYPSENIAQGYLAIVPNGAEVRLRKIADRYFETFKGSGRLQRRELEIELNPDQFHTLWPGTEGQRIEKIRYQMEDKGQKIELDVFQGDLEGLVLAEVEFSSREESEGFDPPDWFGDEVTENVAYKNQNLAR